MKVLAQATPFVLSSLGARADPGAATAQGVIGAIEAATGEALGELRILVHGVGKVGDVSPSSSGSGEPRSCCTMRGRPRPPSPAVASYGTDSPPTSTYWYPLPAVT